MRIPGAEISHPRWEKEQRFPLQLIPQELKQRVVDDVRQHTAILGNLVICEFKLSTAEEGERLTYVTSLQKSGGIFEKIGNPI